jgi:hypothetical protein
MVDLHSVSAGRARTVLGLYREAGRRPDLYIHTGLRDAYSSIVETQDSPGCVYKRGAMAIADIAGGRLENQ